MVRNNPLAGTLAVASASAFAGAALLSQTVIVPGWQAMTPETFLATFAVQGPVTGATVFPVEFAAAVLLAIAAYRAPTQHPARRVWALATVAMVGSVLLIPVYFLWANLAMLDPRFPARAVHAELAAWYGWNWARTGLGLIAAVLAVVALTIDRRHGSR